MESAEPGKERISAATAPIWAKRTRCAGWRGSGTIFFSHCNMRCQYCQNHDISQTQSGYPVDASRLAEIMLELQSMGCHNINLVSPSHVVPQILAAVLVAAKQA
jgi:putative pyruvate formate lyase activating enzyme